MSSMFIQVIACVKSFFFLKTKEYSIIYIDHTWFLHSFIDGDTGFPLFLKIQGVNSITLV